MASIVKRAFWLSGINVEVLSASAIVPTSAAKKSLTVVTFWGQFY
jgi:hypothetical protein